MCARSSGGGGGVDEGLSRHGTRTQRREMRSSLRDNPVSRTLYEDVKMKRREEQLKKRREEKMK